MEDQLTSLEKKIDDLLASVDGNAPPQIGEYASESPTPAASSSRSVNGTTNGDERKVN